MATERDALTGITPPLVTPFRDGSIDWDSYGSLLEHVLDGGVDGVFPCGTTGEAASLTLAEREALVEETVARTPDSIPVLVGGTSSSLPETIEWADTVAALGGDALVATAPYFHEANDPAGHRMFFEQLADESPLPIILYNIPAYVGSALPRDIVVELAAHPSIIGLKDSSGDLEYGLAIVDRTSRDFLVVQGYDGLVLPALRTGFDGGINAGANVIPEAFGSLRDEPMADRARTIHAERIQPIFALCRKHGFAPGTKAALFEIDVLSSHDVRPPLVPIDTTDVKRALQ